MRYISLSSRSLTSDNCDDIRSKTSYTNTYTNGNGDININNNTSLPAASRSVIIQITNTKEFFHQVAGHVKEKLRTFRGGERCQCILYVYIFVYVCRVLCSRCRLCVHNALILSPSVSVPSYAHILHLHLYLHPWPRCFSLFHTHHTIIHHTIHCYYSSAETSE